MRPPPWPPGRPLRTLLAMALATLAAGSRPGCPPPISRFLSYPARVTVPRVAPVKVATLSFAENTYFGSARCSLVQDLRDPEQTLLTSFRLEEAELVEAGAAVKQCSIYLVNDKIAETVLNVEVILIVSLNEGYKRFCESNSLISSTANIEISFCDPDVCLDKAKDWEIVENVISFKAGRSVDGGLNPLTRTLEVTGDQEVVVEAATEPPQAEAEAGSVAVGKEPDPDVNKKILLGLTLVVTLIALSLVLGLIYFWCPALCCCMRAAPRGEASLDTTKILTVRDAEGRVLEAARSVEVWKTEANKIKTLEVLDSIVRTRDRRRRKHRRYSHLLHTHSGSGSGGSSNFFSDPETTRGGEAGAGAGAGMKVISVGESLDGVIILRPGHGGRVAVLEQLDPRRLHLDTEPRLRRLSFSRHYSAGSGRGTPASTNRHVR